MEDRMMALSRIDQRLKKFLKEGLSLVCENGDKEKFVGNKNSPLYGVLFLSKEDAALEWTKWVSENPKEYRNFYSGR